MGLNINDAVVSTAVVEAVLKALPQEERDKLIKDSLREILTSRKHPNGYGETPSVLDTAFRSAAEQIARKTIGETLATDEAFKAGVQAIVKNVVTKLFEEPARVEIEGAIIAAIVTTFGKASRNY